MVQRVVLLSCFFAAIGVYLAHKPVQISVSANDAGSSVSVAPPVRPEHVALVKKINSQAPKGNYIVIDTGENILYLKKGEEILYKAQISAGSGSILQEPSGERKWVFDTPRGVFPIVKKTKNPIWIKPDWAFIEEGEKVPVNFNDRVEVGAMGDYAIGIGDGYFIHGTLYTRLLGRNVSHGCVRVNDQDLQHVFPAVSAGSKVIIF